MAITVILPAFNEELALGAVLEALARLFCEEGLPGRVVVVNDGSTDRTAEVARSFRTVPVALVEHPTNRGLSEAMRTGLREAFRHAADNDILVTMDADNTHSPSFIAPMTRSLEAGYDAVIASRYAPGAKVVGLSLSRKVYSLGASRLFRLLFPIPGVKDYTCGYRAYRAGPLQRALERWGDHPMGPPGFSCSVEILLKLRHLGARMTEVPFTLRYDRKPGESKMPVTKTIWGTLLLAWRWWGQGKR